LIVVEDNYDLREEIVFHMRRSGFDAVGVADGRALERWRAEFGVDIVILDLTLPGEDGFSIARRLSQEGETGIIMLTARNDVDDVVHGLEVGADIYLTKPVDMRALTAAVNALWRRLERPEKTVVEISQRAKWNLDTRCRWLYSPEGNRIPLSVQEACLLSVLALHPEGASREDIAGRLGFDPRSYDYRRLETLVSRLRRKLREYMVEDELLRAVRGTGYAFGADILVM